MTDDEYLAPSLPTTINEGQSFAPTNILCVSILDGILVSNDTSSREQSPYLLVTCADRSIYAYGASQMNFELLETLNFHSSPALSLAKHASSLVSTDMAGETILSSGGRAFERRKDHSKYVVKATSYALTTEASTRHYLATAGWDRKVHVYCQQADQSGRSFDLSATIALESNPESLLFTTHRDTNEPILILSRHDSTRLYFYAISPSTEGLTNPTQSPLLLGTQNLAPHSSAWASFTPASLALHPHDPTLIAIATSHTPHMKLIIAHLLFPPSPPPPSSPPPPQDPAATARLSLAMQNREDAALLVHVSTLAPQTPYSTPQVVWRPDGSGVWVNGDDGCVRGLDAGSGKVVCTLRGGHEAGAKVRTICAGLVKGEDGVEKEIMVSGGFDRRAIVWSIKDG